MTKLLEQNIKDQVLRKIILKISANQRISPDDGLVLFESGDIGLLACLANRIKEKLYGDAVFYNRNIHIEPTNLCVFDCKFCSYSRLIRQKNDPDAWEMNEDEIIERILRFPAGSITEVHIVGGVHPKMTLKYFASLINKISAIRPQLHVKAFTAVELEYMCRKAGVSYRDGLKYLKENGLESLPGGGAEIFDETLRREICEDKCTSQQWLEIHETAHSLKIPSNATMLYGHIETFIHRIDHMERLRQLQDRTHGFNAFIPLKFRNRNNQMSAIPETPVMDDLRTYAISRIYLDNFSHIKAYWPMIGKETTRLLLNYGVDDIDGTIDDTTKIYSMAGAEEQHPVMTSAEMISLIRSSGRNPVERDTLYKPLANIGSD